MNKYLKKFQKDNIRPAILSKCLQNNPLPLISKNQAVKRQTNRQIENNKHCKNNLLQLDILKNFVVI